MVTAGVLATARRGGAARRLSAGDGPRPPEPVFAHHSAVVGVAPAGPGRTSARSPACTARPGTRLPEHAETPLRCRPLLGLLVVAVVELVFGRRARPGGALV